jgi:CheY-like chemotaxis protein
MADTLDRDAGALRILVVDDCEDAAESLALLTQIWGHTPRVAFGGASALTAFEQERPDVVIADLAMPGTSGLEMAREMRTRPGGIRPVLIAHSCFVDEGRRREAFDAGFDYFIAKPADPAALERLLIGIREYVSLVAALRDRQLGRKAPINERSL